MAEHPFLSHSFNLFNSLLPQSAFTETYEANEWKQGEWSGTTSWWDESKGSKLTGRIESEREPYCYLRLPFLSIISVSLT